jgi:two-component system cell cycle response regulator
MLEELRSGTTYLIRERKGQAAFELFCRLTAKERPGLCITRKHPEVARSYWDLPEGVQLKWLTPSVGKDRVDPTALSTLTKMVYQFVVENPRGVVLLDGLEYLLLHNEFSKTLLFLEHLNDFVMQSEGLLLVPINPEALEEQDIALLERNTEVLEGEKVVSKARVEKFVQLIDRYLKG